MNYFSLMYSQLPHSYKTYSLLFTVCYPVMFVLFYNYQPELISKIGESLFSDIDFYYLLCLIAIANFIWVIVCTSLNVIIYGERKSSNPNEINTYFVFSSLTLMLVYLLVYESFGVHFLNLQQSIFGYLSIPVASIAGVNLIWFVKRLVNRPD